MPPYDLNSPDRADFDLPQEYDDLTWHEAITAEFTRLAQCKGFSRAKWCEGHKVNESSLSQYLNHKKGEGRRIETVLAKALFNRTSSATGSHWGEYTKNNTENLVGLFETYRYNAANPAIIKSGSRFIYWSPTRERLRANVYNDALRRPTHPHPYSYVEEIGIGAETGNISCFVSWMGEFRCSKFRRQGGLSGLTLLGGEVTTTEWNGSQAVTICHVAMVQNDLSNKGLWRSNDFRQSFIGSWEKGEVFEKGRELIELARSIVRCG